jgi:hypothetical protein
MKFANKEEFELHVHKCFGKIFESLMKIDGVVKQEAEKEETSGNHGTMCDLRDSIEDVILHCHLAWQYHRLSRTLQNVSTWDQVENNSESSSIPQEKTS